MSLVPLGLSWTYGVPSELIPNMQRNWVTHSHRASIFLEAIIKCCRFLSIDSCNGDVHHEIELVENRGQDNEPSHMALGLDLTKRSIQDHLKEKSLPWAEAKAFTGSAVLGNWVEYNPEAEYSLEVNGNEVQRGSLAMMSWTPQQLIAKLANWAPIREGDILFTGTPSGVGPLSKNDEVIASLYIEGEHILSHHAKCV